jgi:hypothetical protein
VNAETANLIERPYQEIVDDILTAIVGGVVNEPIIFDVKSDLYPLAEPSRAIRSITGTTESPDAPDGVHHTFQKEIDFLFDEDKNAVVWQKGGAKPKDETNFYVDYFRPNSRSPLTDINVGSVTRTLGEAIGREIGTVYQQINLAYRSGFIDSAEGKALDFVVAILGVTRKTKQFAVGLVTFFRDLAVEGNITIPQGTELATAKGDAVFQTTEPRTLQRGQARIDAPVRAADKFKGEAGKVDAGKITSLAQIIAGVARVSNFEATFLAAEDETDEELRQRARAALRGLGKATITSLMRAVFENRAKLMEISDPNTPGGERTPGKVSMLVETEPPRFPSLVAAVNDVRAAGVQVTIEARFVFVTPRLVVNITPGLTGQGKSKIVNDIITALQEYFESLPTDAPATGTELLAVIGKVKDVSQKQGGRPDVTIADVRTWRADVDRKGADPLVEALVASVSNVNPSDTDALRTAIKEVVDVEGLALAPSGRREPDRSLVQGVDDGGRASSIRAADGEIAAGKFIIVPPGQFSLVLDMEPADIVLQEG